MDEFDEQAQAFTRAIESELADGRLNFPVSMEVSMRIKRLADDPDSTLDRIAAAVQADPVLSAKVVRMANTVALNPYGAHIDTVRDAVRRIGLGTLRMLAFAVASEQLAGDHRSPNMRTVASGLWARSIDVAAWSFALARHTRAVNADVALLAGMMTHIGQFFLLARASDYPALERSIDRFAQLVDRLHGPVGLSVLEVFDMPESILDLFDAAPTHADGWPPHDLAGISRLAGLISEVRNPFDGLLGRRLAWGVAAAVALGIDAGELEAIVSASHAERDEIVAAVRG